MSRGNVGGKSAKIEAFHWLSAVKVGERTGGPGSAGRDGASSGTGSGQNSGNASRVGSRSRHSSREPARSRSGGIDGENNGFGLPSTLSGPAWMFSTGGRDRDASGGHNKRSASTGRWEGEEEGQSLQEE